MPANFIRFPNSDRRVFEVRKARPARSAATLELSLETLADWGSLRVPGHIWRALSRLGVWVEPVLVSEWGRLIRGYVDKMGGLTPADAIDRQLAWEEPMRSTTMGKEASQRLAAAGSRLHCVWTGMPLSSSQLDIDHCFPWAAWPCGDLWNLVPSHRRVNQHQKGARIPSAEVLAAARERIVGWWMDAWLEAPALRERFGREVVVALPVEDANDLDQVFAGLEWRRMRLRQDQQLTEWGGSAIVATA